MDKIAAAGARGRGGNYHRTVAIECRGWVMSAKVTLRQANGYYAEELDGEYLIFRLGTHRAIHLNQMAGVIWRLCDGTRSAGEIAELLASEYPDDAQNVAQDVNETLGKLKEMGALYVL